MYTAEYLRPRQDPRIEVCSLEHSGPLPVPWLASGFVVNLVVEGEADLRSRGGVYHVGPGQVVLANPGQLRAVTRRHTRTAKTRSVTVAGSDLREAMDSRSRACGVAYFESATTCDPLLRQELAVLYAALDRSVPRLALETAVENLLGGLCRVLTMKEPSRWPAHPGVRRAKEFIEDHVEADVSLLQLVQVSGLSRAHLIREFRRQTGIPPHQYQIHSRVRRGKDLLRRGSSVAAAAAASGFFDQAHFARHFRRLIGVSARDYQRSIATRQTSDDHEA